jgi:hypothetical protein
MAAENDILYAVWQWFGTEVCIKLRKGSKQTLQILKEAYGPEVMGRPTIFRW